MMTGNEDGCPSDSGSSYYGAEYPLLTDSQDGYGATDNGLDGSGYSLGFGDGGAGEGDYGQDYSYTWGDSGPNAGQGGQGFLYDGGDGAGQSVPDYSRLCGNIGDNYGANTDDFGTVTKEPAPGSSQDPCEEILAGIQNEIGPTKIPNAVDNDPTPFQAGVRGFVDGLGAGAANVLQALALYQSDYLNQARDRAWSDQPTRGTWMETGSNAGAAVSAAAAYTALGCKVTGFNPSIKVGLHGPHHGLGPHLQVNTWTPGVPGSGGALRLPLP